MRKPTDTGWLILAAIIGVVAILALTVGCGSNPKHRAVVVDTAIAGSLFALQDAEADLFSQGIVTPEQHRQFNKALVPALKAGQSLNTALMAWKPGDAPPVELATIVRSVQQATDAVVLLLPPAGKDRLLPLVLASQQAVLTVLLIATGAQ